MKIFKRLLLLGFAVSALPLSGFAQNKLNVVTTLSTYADIARIVGGEFIDVKYVANPRFDPHFIEPKPSDVFKVKKADLFIHSGLDLEAWRDPLVDAAARKDIRSGGERQLDLSQRISLLDVPDRSITRAEGDIHAFGNPHYWMDPRNGVIIAEEIAEKLIALDPAHADSYRSSLDKFRRDIAERVQVWEKELAPFRGMKLVGYHDGWVYLVHFAGLSMERFLEPNPGIPPTPRQIESIVSYIQAEKIQAIVQSGHDATDAGESVTEKTGTKVLVLSQGVGDLEESRDYFSMFDYNISQLLGALKHE